MKINFLNPHIKISFQAKRSSDDITDVYHSDVAKYPLLSRKEELECANKIRSKAPDAAAAREKLINGNLRFVRSVAYQYRRPGFDVRDLIQEGNDGLIKAATKYDPKKGVKFISYAVWWIRNSIQTHIKDNTGCVKIPANTQIALRKLEKDIIKLTQKLQHNPSLEEIAEHKKMSVKKVSEILAVKEQNGASLDSPISENGATLMDVIKDTSQDLEKNIILDQRKNALHDAFSQLDSRMVQMVKLYRGIGVESRSYDDIAKIFGQNRESVRTAVRKTEKKLAKILLSKPK